MAVIKGKSLKGNVLEIYKPDIRIPLMERCTRYNIRW